MSRLRRALGWIVTGLFSSAAFQACGSSSESPSTGGPTAGSAGTAGSSQNDGMVVDPPESGGAGGESPYSPLCGITSSSCMPDDERSCSPGTAGTNSGSGGSGGRGGAGTSAGQSGKGGAGSGGGAGSSSSASGGEAGAAGNDQGGHGGVTGDAGEGAQSGTGPVEPPLGEGGAAGARTDSGGESAGGQPPASAGESFGAASGAAGLGAGAGGSSGGIDENTETRVPRSCQVVLRDGEPRSTCAPSGEGVTSEGCFSSADCAPGLACVGETSPGQCRPYCCTGDAACTEPGTHCTERRLVGTTGRPAVPVCMPATGCNLAEEYPCPDSATCACAAGTACMVVTSDGKTSCVPASSLPGPDEGQEGQACPCAWGHLCSPETDRCVRLCQTAAPGDACAGRRCQFAGGLPPGWGVCLTSSGADAG
jgi:hypothetical protein